MSHVVNIVGFIPGLAIGTLMVGPFLTQTTKIHLPVLASLPAFIGSVRWALLA